MDTMMQVLTDELVPPAHLQSKTALDLETICPCNTVLPSGTCVGAPLVEGKSKGSPISLEA
jgi:hypothetical protein